jgi:orotidine-5'-phosphate decarboxylase
LFYGNLYANGGVASREDPYGLRCDCPPDGKVWYDNLELSTAAAARMGVFQPMSTPHINAHDRLIVALDLADIEEAQNMVRALEGAVSFFKVGLTLQLAPGVEQLIKSLIDEGKKVFLDYKYFDIPATLKTAVGRAASRGVSFLTIHGSSAVMRAAVEGRGNSDLKLFTVTVLTSWDKADLLEMGYSRHSVKDLVVIRARKALEAGIDGVIASGQEAQVIKQLSSKLLVVTPGIRPDGYPEDDQKRRTTPSQAILAGADYLVIGRPITDASNPRRISEQILSEMQVAFDSLPQTNPALGAK